MKYECIISRTQEKVIINKETHNIFKSIGKQHVKGNNQKTKLLVIYHLIFSPQMEKSILDIILIHDKGHESV